jgi:hypothetical protein
VLLATEDGKTVLLVTATGLFGGAVTWAANYLTQRRREARKDHREDEDTAIGRYKDLLDRTMAKVQSLQAEMDARNEEHQRQIDQLRERMHLAEVREVRLLAHIQHLEDLMGQHKIPFRRWAAAGETPTAAPPEGQL